MDAQVAVGRLHEPLELIEREGFVDRQRADDPQPQPLVYEPVERERAAARLTALFRSADGMQSLCAVRPLSLRSARPAWRCSILTHRASVRSTFQISGAGRRSRQPSRMRTT